MYAHALCIYPKLYPSLSKQVVLPPCDSATELLSLEGYCMIEPYTEVRMGSSNRMYYMVPTILYYRPGNAVASFRDM
jgi:hypothetical protein